MFSIADAASLDAQEGLVYIRGYTIVSASAFLRSIFHCPSLVSYTGTTIHVYTVIII